MFYTPYLEIPISFKGNYQYYGNSYMLYAIYLEIIRTAIIIDSIIIQSEKTRRT